MGFHVVKATDEVAPAPVTCPVCAGALGDEVGCACVRCATPHHRRCFEYARGCAVFACEGRSHRAWEPAAPATLSPERDLARGASTTEQGMAALAWVCWVLLCALMTPLTSGWSLLAIPLGLLAFLAVGYLRVSVSLDEGGAVVRRVRLGAATLSEVRVPAEEVRGLEVEHGVYGQLPILRTWLCLRRGERWLLREVLSADRDQEHALADEVARRLDTTAQLLEAPSPWAPRVEGAASPPALGPAQGPARLDPSGESARSWDPCLEPAPTDPSDRRRRVAPPSAA